jgi:cellulose synthase/poly-beta-1,6-N-acetylglucosamine synthase-like glycosyltransferase
MTGVLVAVFWTSAAVLGATYFGYPLVVFLLSRFVRRSTFATDGMQEPVTLIIAARDEEEVIGQKLRTCLDQDYPEDLLKIIVVSDGSTDGTIDAVKKLGSPRISIIAVPSAAGKASALNEAMSSADTEIVVMSDARQALDPYAVSRLVRWFSDERFGAVSGDLHFPSRPERGIERAAAMYWSYERRIRESEARIDSCIGATGALYAIRRALWKPLPSGLILDDMFTPMQIALQGYRVQYETEAAATDRLPISPGQEFRRRVRTLSGNYQLVEAMPELLIPWRNRLWIQFMFHKIGRLVSPLALFLTFVASAFIPGKLYSVLFAAQVFVWIGGLGLRSEWLPPFLRRPHGVLRTFALFQVAAAVAFWRFVRHDYDVWRPGTTLIQPESVVLEHGLSAKELPETLATQQPQADSERRRSQW